MKIIRLTEYDLTNIVKKVIKENSLRQDLIQQIKEDGWEETSELVGGSENLKKLTGLDNLMDFLHLFDDLNVVQSEEEPNVTLYRYKKGHNLIYYDRENNNVYVSYEDIWSFLEDPFEEPSTIKIWFDKVYNLRDNINNAHYFGEEIGGRWMRHTI
jgi:hypothetical protein